MASIPIMLGLSALSGLGGIFGNKKQEQTSTFSKNSQSDTTGSTTPQYDPANLAMRDTLLDYYRRSLDQDPDLSGYKAQGIAGIQQAGNARTMAIKNSLASRGLSYSPIAAVAPAMSENSRIGDISSFVNQVPLLAENLRAQRLQAAGSYQSSLPVGQTNVSETKSGESGKSTGTQPGNMVGGGLTSAATTLAGLYGKSLGQKG